MFKAVTLTTKSVGLADSKLRVCDSCGVSPESSGLLRALFRSIAIESRIVISTANGFRGRTQSNSDLALTCTWNSLLIIESNKSKLCEKLCGHRRWRRGGCCRRKCNT